jgi:hypothetical protein
MDQIGRLIGAAPNLLDSTVPIHFESAKNCDSVICKAIWE